MGKTRLEAFSDGVIAIIITIMVLEMKVPHDAEWSGLVKLWPVFLSYVLSFVNVGIYWNNHHHMLHAVQKVDGAMLWANLHLLFWLSLMPFTTGWMGENHFAPLPMAIYGVDLLMCAVSYKILQRCIIGSHGSDSALAKAIGSTDWKGNIPFVVYSAGIVASFWSPIAAALLYVSIALMWLIPDRRIERTLGSEHE